MITNNPGLGQKIIETSRRGIKAEYSNCTITGPIPVVTEDGGYEIHPVLNGITFYFWKSQDPTLRDFSYVTFKGHAPEAPWAWQLTGWLSDSPEDSLKGFLREKSARLAEESGFIYNPQKHGYRWMNAAC